MQSRLVGDIPIFEEYKQLSHHDFHCNHHTRSHSSQSLILYNLLTLVPFPPTLIHHASSIHLHRPCWTPCGVPCCSGCPDFRHHWCRKPAQCSSMFNEWYTSTKSRGLHCSQMLFGRKDGKDMLVLSLSNIQNKQTRRSR